MITNEGTIRFLLLALPVLLVLSWTTGPQAAHAQKEATTPTKAVAVIPPEDRPDLSVETDLRTSSDTDTLRAAEEGAIAITVVNQGGGPAKGVQVRIVPKTTTSEVQIRNAALQADMDTIEVATVESLAASMSKTVTVPVQTDRVLSGDPVELAVEVTEQRGFGLDEMRSLTLPVESYRPPSLTLSGFEVSGTDKQQIRPDTVSEVALRVKNTGNGPARGLRAEVEVVEGGTLLAKAGASISVDDTAPGETTTLPVELKPNAGAESLPLRIQIRSIEDPYQTTEQITLPVAVPDRPPLVDREIPTTNTSREDAVAVVVGVRNYQRSKVPNVTYAERDAKTVGKYLVETLGFREGNVLELINPTKAEMAAVFGTGNRPEGRLSDYLRSDTSEVFVFYSGHGAPNPEEDGRTYFLPSNGSPRQLSITGYPVNQLYENLAKLTSGPVTVAIDACFSGQSEGGALVRNASPALLSVENPMVGMENGMVMTASKADQISSWYPEKKHGLFTYFLLKGLRGEADENQDGELTGKEMKNYLSENVSYYARRLHSRTQSPQVMGKGADRALVRYDTAGESTVKGEN